MHDLTTTDLQSTRNPTLTLVVSPRTFITPTCSKVIIVIYVISDLLQ